MEILKIENLSLVYRSPAGETEAIKDISFTADEGEFLAIVGPSGCGKTTILSAISALITPSRGSILLDGKKVTPGGSTGYMLQRDQLFEWRTIYKNVLLGLEVQKKLTEENKKYALSLLEKYGLGEFANRYPSQLSGGMRQRAALIRTLAFRPRLLLLDEPFSALDYQTRLNVCNDVHSIIKSEGTTAILVTHDISEAISIADRVLVLTNRPAEIKDICRIDLQGSPLKRRENGGFSVWFDRIWKEIC